MCGIVGAVAKRDVVPFLVDGLKRLEYRGYAPPAWPFYRINCVACVVPVVSPKWKAPRKKKTCMVMSV